MTLKELFKQNPEIIINTDIDGFLSGMILQTYLGCKVVGFSNSKSEVWVSPEITDIYKPVYIDLFVSRPDVYCVEQHIITIDEEHCAQMKRLGTKFNPNLERNHRNFVDDYYHKYPFATVHYIIAKLVAEGIYIKLPKLNQECCSPDGKYQTQIGHIILRADDAMFSSLSAYKDNAESWWQWLEVISKYSRLINQLRNFIGEQDPKLSAVMKKEIGDFFKKGLLCDGADGAFTHITDATGKLQARVRAYADFLTAVFGWDINLPEVLTLHQGQFLKRFTNPKTVGEVRSMIEDPSMYSYAFIYGPHSKFQNFSYTTFME